ncbi:hypothetical protein Afil01_24570 [Actinorhabdospora filicis]|uniref:Activator of Hsp90 ATPase homologue 1/2-like C-terminal domain-containing protein n=1 Tax=Actinorhabdospora filicis TaxID=1785913 RepID=A0A9W6SIE0_9ACTN|nr:SRPBCC domain-containing protein [Actinorhabdospora filicis]GLZ77650.1 hypothetical protein Afil01_24570 [Actinorhabdospora filicis]
MDIVNRLSLRCSPTRAFYSYADLGAWWPARYSADPATLESVVLEPRVGGAVTSTHTDGLAYTWGEVVTWDPPSTLAHTSTLAQDPGTPTVVRVRFTPEGEGTLVEHFHEGWREGNLADRPKFGDWPLILRAYREHAESA